MEIVIVLELHELCTNKVVEKDAMLSGELSLDACNGVTRVNVQCNQVATMLHSETHTTAQIGTLPWIEKALNFVVVVVVVVVVVAIVAVAVVVVVVVVVVSEFPN